NLPGDHPGYFARPQLIQNLSAVTFACAMVRREVFEELGGLNDNDLCIAFNDVDFCLRAREAGYLVVYTPYALLYHHESISRGFEDNPEKLARFHAEIHYMEERHGGLLQKGDPYYNPNLCLTESFQPRLDYADDLPL
ncbi:MAG: glycosyltransferase family 2 protein, partial [Dokdonella sp.]